MIQLWKSQLGCFALNRDNVLKQHMVKGGEIFVSFVIVFYYLGTLVGISDIVGNAVGKKVSVGIEVILGNGVGAGVGTVVGN